LSSKHQDLKTRLSGETGAQFDRTFMDAMVTGHRDAIKLFEQEMAASPSRPQSASKPTDSEVLAVAKELLPSIKHHLEEAEKIQKGLKK
jgi:putative membrane protein